VNTTTTTPTEQPDWLSKIANIIRENPILTTKQRVRTVLKLDPRFDSICYDVTKYRPMINGVSLEDRDISSISSIMTDEYAKAVCTIRNERATDLSRLLIKECVEDEAYDKPYNPRTAYILDCYQKHGDTGLALLDTWLEKVGCTIEVDGLKPLLGPLGRKFIVQSVARVFQPACQADTGLILHDPVGDKSKSRFWRALAVKSEWINESGIGDLKDEKKTGELVSPYWYVIFDENSSLTRGELGALKKTWTLTKDTYRSAYGMFASDKLRQCVFGGTTNVLNLFLDEGGIARRFPIVDVTEVDIDWLKANRDQLYAAAFHVYRQNLKDGVLTHDPEVEHGFNPVKIHDDDYKSVEERIKANCHWWFSEEHEPRLYGMLGALSVRTLVKLSWQEELDYQLALIVGQRVATRALKESLGLNGTKVTEDQIGRYMGKLGIHKKLEKVSYTEISRDGMKHPVRLAGWLIGGSDDETRQQTSTLQSKVTKAEEKAEHREAMSLVMDNEDDNLDWSLS
jgi:Virulence-associated protein E